MDEHISDASQAYLDVDTNKCGQNIGTDNFLESGGTNRIRSNIQDSQMKE